MTSPRIPIFQRKGGNSSDGKSSSAKPSLVIAIGHGKPPMGGDDGEQDDNEVTCPKCGCEFDPETGKIESQGEEQQEQSQGPSDLHSKIAAMMGAGGGNVGQ